MNTTAALAADNNTSGPTIQTSSKTFKDNEVDAL
jgi:hypothetical protein